MLAVLQLLQRGIPFLYQGQEIGMTNVVFQDIAQVDDVASRDQYQAALEAGYSEEEALRIVNLRSRDNCRTPFQWSSEKNAGFTDGTPWLMVNSNYRKINLKSQQRDERSVYSFYKKLIRLRKEEEYKDTFVYGTFRPAYEEHNNIFAYYRESERQRIAVIANYQKESQELMLTDQCEKVLLNNYRDLSLKGGRLYLEGYQAVVLLLNKISC